jgi:peptide/nickel transport system ATP-binding protein
MWLDGAPLPPMRSRKRRDPSRRLIQMVFQDPYSSLNARHRVLDILTEPLWLYGLAPDPARRDRLARAMLALVGLPALAAGRYPHQFSGGQRQRIAVARALLSRPGLLICDEPTSALDVSIQAQVLNLLKDLQARFGLTTLFISHNLAVVRQMSDDIAVLKDGRWSRPARLRPSSPALPPPILAICCRRPRPSGSMLRPPDRTAGRIAEGRSGRYPGAGQVNHG